MALKLGSRVRSRARGTAVALIAAAPMLLASSVSRAQPETPAPSPVRNDRARAGQEFLVLRHQKLRPASHERFYELSRDGVWPYFEKIGSRVVGQWQVVYPEGGGSPEVDEGYRLARYRSFNHWVATRSSQSLGGNGPDYQAMRSAIAERRELMLGSDGAIYLTGTLAPGGPYYLPGTGESFEPVPSGDAVDARPVRHDRVRPGQEIVTLRYFAIEKGTFPEFYELSRSAVWPYFEKMGARVIGQWLAVRPGADELGRLAPAMGEARPGLDEVYMMTRYASYEHWQATRPAVMVRNGGDGPDYVACRDALERRREMTRDTWVRFLQGHLYASPPVHLPPLDESYRLASPP